MSERKNPRLVFVSRSIDVATGGGIGAYVTAQARLLSRYCDVTVIAPEAAAGKLTEAFADTPRVEAIAVPPMPPEAAETFFGAAHAWSAAAWRAIERRFAPGEPPDYIEFPDFGGEGAVTVQARRTADALLSDTVVGVRAYTTAEMVAVLNGRLERSPEAVGTYEVERLALAGADFFVHAGGDVAATYERFYGPEALAPPRLVRHPTELAPVALGEGSQREPGDDLRLLYLGRLERRKGVADLISALAGSPLTGWRLTLAGADTATGPAGASMEEVLRLAAADDPRIEFRPPVPHSEVGELIGAHDAVIVPSLWECWPNVGLEALARNRPLLATPVGGLEEMAREGHGGMLAASGGAGGVADLVERAVNARGTLRELIREVAPRRHFETLAADDTVAEQYDELIRGPRRHVFRVPARKRGPLVSVVVPYYRLERFVEQTVRSVFDQPYRPIEVIVVNDGSFRAKDLLLFDLAERYPIKLLTKLNAGLGAARNSGIAQARGKYVLPLDADNMLEPGFIERAVGVLESRADVAFVSAWVRFVDEQNAPLHAPVGLQPLGNQATALEAVNMASDAVAVIRRSLFDEGFAYDEELISFEDWSFYRGLRAAGRIGQVIPERLIRYRVRSDSMLRTDGTPNFELLEEAMLAIDRDGEMRWTSQAV
ncbi:MAG: glycosyltransferase [Actinobacteria bacterium]|nr:glycosyltransferase [Actinomycetota bacterium]